MKNEENEILKAFYPDGRVPEDPPEEESKSLREQFKDLEEDLEDSSRAFRANVRAEKSRKKTEEKALLKDRSWLLLTLRGSTPREEAAAAIGIDPEELAAYEHAEKDMSKKDMQKIADYYGCKPKKLMDPIRRKKGDAK